MVARSPAKIAACLIAFFLATISSSQAEDFEGYLPPNVDVSVALNLKGLKGSLRNTEKGFRIDPKGRATLLIEKTLFILNQDDLLPYPLKDGGSLSNYAWASGGALIGIEGKKLGFPGPDGFQNFIDLPEVGMKLAPGDKNRLYLYGGKSRKQRLHLYLLDKEKGLSHLAEMPYPITAVAGTGESVFIAVGRSILFMSPNKPLSLVYRPKFEVTALAYAPPHGLFYATDESVGFVSKPGLGFTFMKENRVKPMVSGNDLFLIIPDKSILKITPTESFSTMAEELVKDR